MAAEALEQAGKAKGVEVHIEGQGSGKVDWLDPALVARADAVIFAHDLPVKDRDRFAGKPVIDVGVKVVLDQITPAFSKCFLRSLVAINAPVPASTKVSTPNVRIQDTEK